MGRTMRNLQRELLTFQVAERPQRSVIQAIEPEAEQVLLESGGKVLRDQEGYLYEEYLDNSWPTLIIYWPSQTRSVYLPVLGQEDNSYVILAVALLPGSQSELHLTYNYRLRDPIWGPWEEFFTLRMARCGSYLRSADERWHCGSRCIRFHPRFFTRGAR